MIRYSKLWEYANEKGLTGYTLEKKYGINRRQIQRLKQGGDIRLSTLNRICSIIGCSPVDILEFTPDPIEPVTIDGQAIYHIHEEPLALSDYTSHTRPPASAPSTSIGANLAALLKEHQISAPELSRRSGIPIPTINRIKYGKTKNPRTETLMAIAQVFGVPIEALTASTKTTV